MREILLAKYGELALKGLNRGSFESQLLRTVRKRTAAAGNFKVSKAQSTIYVEPLDENCDIDGACRQLTRIFGIASISRAAECPKDLDSIFETAAAYLKESLENAATFKVSAKRSDKTFPLNSMELSKELGAFLLERYPRLSVKMDDPDLSITVEVRDFAAYVHAGRIEAAGGIPAPTSGRAAVMLSGGIDSPVAAFLMAKRGLDLCAVHFQSPPYTSERALDKVERIAARLSIYTGNLALLCVPFTDVQLAIRDHAPEGFFTLIMRRSMVRITRMLCECEHCGAMVTGESLGQVASQTLQAITCTDEAAAGVPILRPLIGMDKTEIVSMARKIGTFDISIEPYEDCCTLFTPKHPKTKPKLADVIRAEAGIPDLHALEETAAGTFHVRMKHFFD